ncbi:uncharacterized protein BT62DRAFT_763486 [Guyanagaster necrorhizus]|uniref:Uncharacterized protein n=1 Tax=Guyanagaster necrorhizus TaxID=856835 RepID=A0A9P7VVH8_9AGAR|nr:uncharacterized protein BT62DRAFT_763486 [Guyanagaster necrorhizus MCA 3950]KAG7448291.1 hypothetical protein BT62DRAFT_763486 [Guyanagaster necrorhizus MCA 3950]
MEEGTRQFTDYSFFNMVSLRWKSKRLKAVHLTVPETGEDLSWSLTSEHIDELQKFKNDGLNIHLAVERYIPGPNPCDNIALERFV